LIPVIKVEDISHMVHLERGLLMLKVIDVKGLRKAAETLGAKIIDHEADSYFIAEFTGSPEEVDTFLVSIDAEYIIEASRTGPVGMRRGSKGFVV